MWTIIKVFIESVTILLLFWFFGREACGILAPRPGIEPTPPVLEGEVLTTGLPGRGPVEVFLIFWNKLSSELMYFLTHNLLMGIQRFYFFIQINLQYFGGGME